MNHADLLSADFWIGSLFRACWQGSLFILAVWGLCRLFPRVPASWRCGLWWLACLKPLVALFWVVPLTLFTLPAVSPVLPLSQSPRMLPVSRAFQSTPRKDTTPSDEINFFAEGAASSAPTAQYPQDTQALIHRHSWYDNSLFSFRDEGEISAFPLDTTFVPPSLALFQEKDRSKTASPHAARLHRDQEVRRASPSQSAKQSQEYSALCNLRSALILFWIGSVLVGLSLAVGHLLLLCRLARRAQPLQRAGARQTARQLAANIGLRTLPPLRTTAQVGPLALGLFRPMVLLPLCLATRLSLPELRIILAHEFVHIRRGDLWLGLVPILARALFCFHPLVLLACREYEQAREEACDAQTLTVTGTLPDAYGQLLLKLGVQSGQTEPVAAYMATVHYRTLQRRLTMLQLVPGQTRPSRRVALAALLWIGAVGIVPWRIGIAQTEPTGNLASPRKVIHSVQADSRTTLPVSPLPDSARQVSTQNPAEAPANTAATVRARNKTVSRSTFDATAPLFSEPQLQQKIFVHAEGIPVGELLTLISKQAGIALSAKDALADEKIIVFGPPRPLKALLKDMAVLFNNTWMRGKTADGRLAYIMVRGQRAQEYEAALRDATPRRSFSSLLALKLNSLEARALLQAGQEEVAPHKSWADVYRRISTLSPDNAVASKRALHNYAAGNWQNAPNPKAGDIAYSLLQSMALAAGEQNGAQDRIPILGDLPLIGHTFRKHLSSANVPEWQLPPHGDPYSKQAISRRAALPNEETIHAAMQEPSWVDQLRALAEMSGKPVMADFYRNRPQPPWTPLSKLAKGTDPLWAALDALCHPQGYLWWAHEDTLLLRRRDWYHQQAYEVPDRWLRDMAGRLQAQGGQPTPADLIRLRELTPQQIVGLTRSLGDLGYDESQIAGLPEMLNFLAATWGNRAQIWREPIAPRPENGENYTETGRFTLHLQRQFEPILQAKQMTVAAGKGQRFRLGLFHLNPLTTEEAQQATQFTIEGAAAILRLCWELDDEQGGEFDMRLPLTLPNDRRDRTRVEIVP
jgi:beta-lactamase regulating signal transducer with metallopeptidase domain